MSSLGAILALVAIAEAGKPDPIRAVLNAQEAAWTRGWQTVRDRYAKKYGSRAKMGRLTFSGLTITPLGAEAALVLGSWSLQRKEDQPRGKFTLLFRRLPEGWRIVLDHTS